MFGESARRFNINATKNVGKHAVVITSSPNRVARVRSRLVVPDALGLENGTCTALKVIVTWLTSRTTDGSKTVECTLTLPTAYAVLR